MGSLEALGIEAAPSPPKPPTLSNWNDVQRGILQDQNLPSKEPSSETLLSASFDGVIRVTRACQRLWGLCDPIVHRVC